MLDTDADRVSADRLKDAEEGIKDLQQWLDKMKEEMGRHKGGAFPIDWCSIMMEKALAIYGRVSNCNGAVLVRGTDSE